MQLGAKTQGQTEALGRRDTHSANSPPPPPPPPRLDPGKSISLSTRSGFSSIFGSAEATTANRLNNTPGCNQTYFYFISIPCSIPFVPFVKWLTPANSLPLLSSRQTGSPLLLLLQQSKHTEVLKSQQIKSNSTHPLQEDKMEVALMLGTLFNLSY